MFYMEFLALMWNLARFQSDTKSGRFILPTGRSGDLSKFRESPGESGRPNMYGKHCRCKFGKLSVEFQLVQLWNSN